MKKRIAVWLCALGLLAAGCGSADSGGSQQSGSQANGPGTVRVLSAGSLVNLMRDVKPAFASATGGTVENESKGSTALANAIKGKVRQGDVFVSASTKANDPLRGAQNGNWESWYAAFAKAPLVIAYNPESKFVKDLKSKPWQQVITEPGFTMGATDPKLDPKGKLTAEALKKVGLDESAVKVFPEEQLLARLSSGNLDAGFFYSSEAADAKLPTVSLGKIHLGATYTVTVLNRAPNEAGGDAFVKYLLGPGKKLLRKHGLKLQPVAVTGDRNAVPAGLRGVLGVS